MFGEIPPSGADGVFDPIHPVTYTMYSYMLSAAYITMEIVQEVAADLVLLKTKLDGLDASMGSIKKSSSAANLLLNEYYSNQDLDGDGLIFGVNFYITDPPKLLGSVPRVGISKTWSNYQNDHPELF